MLHNLPPKGVRGLGQVPYLVPRNPHRQLADWLRDPNPRRHVVVGQWLDHSRNERHTERRRNVVLDGSRFICFTGNARRETRLLEIALHDFPQDIPTLAKNHVFLGDLSQRDARLTGEPVGGWHHKEDVFGPEVVPVDDRHCRG